jgi:hypothetical protein
VTRTRLTEKLFRSFRALFFKKIDGSCEATEDGSREQRKFDAYRIESNEQLGQAIDFA